MLVAFLESFKYVGHMFPIVLLRAFIGWYYLKQALQKYSGEFLFKPLLSHQLSEWLPHSGAAVGYKAFIEEFVIPHPNWVVFAYAITALEFLVAFSYLTGFLVRPLAVLAAFLCFNLAMLSGPAQEPFYLTLFVVHVTLAWLGAGRCFGLDYFFYKRRRGIWW
ncbi:MAG: hypothetical protein RJB66_2475 [Pseudomonadota bacterium]